MVRKKEIKKEGEGWGEGEREGKGAGEEVELGEKVVLRGEWEWKNTGGG